MADPESPDYGDRVALFAALPPVFTLEQIVEAGAAFGFVAYKTFSCLREYQLDELIVQRGETFVKRDDAGTP